MFIRPLPIAITYTHPPFLLRPFYLVILLPPFPITPENVFLGHDLMYIYYTQLPIGSLTGTRPLYLIYTSILPMVFSLFLYEWKTKPRITQLLQI